MIQILEGAAAAQHLRRLREVRDTVLPPRVAARLADLFGREISAEAAVAQIVADVRRHGDRALIDYTRRIEGVTLSALSVGADALQAAYETTPADLQAALRQAAERIRAYHQHEPQQSWLEWDKEGGALGQMIRPIQRVGVYAPGGTAAYPSSLLMAVIPAQVAGVDEILVATPPGPQGTGAAAVLAAAHVAGLDRVFLLGGAQAVAALAYGTESMPRVDKIVGAGGLFVTLAKKQVYGDVGIDGLYGPTETMLIADESARPALVAADLLAQAEHDPLATSLLLTPSAALAQRVQAEVAHQATLLPRQSIIEESMAAQGALLVVDSVDEAVAMANEYAPEHLCLLLADPWSWVGKVRNAGGVFVGEGSSEALGDYVVGPSHVMPTGGTARFASPLHVGDFLKVTSVFAVSEVTARQWAPVAHTIARAEGLDAHAAAVIARLD